MEVIRTSHLAGIGTCEAIHAAMVRVGDIMMWNYGYTEQVLEIRPAGDTQLVFTIRSTGQYNNNIDSTKIATRRMHYGRLVVLYNTQGETQ